MKKLGMSFAMLASVAALVACGGTSSATSSAAPAASSTSQTSVAASSSVEEKKTLNLEAETAGTLTSAGEAADLATVTKVESDDAGEAIAGGKTYVRLVSSWVPADPAYELTYAFNATAAASADIVFTVAAPIADPSQGNMGSVLADMFTLSFNGTAEDIDWNDKLGEPYDVTADGLTWIDVTITKTLATGENKITITTIEKSGDYGNYVWHCTDSVLFDKIAVTSTAVEAK